MILNEYGEIVDSAWLDLINHYSNVKLDSYIIMPDHFHGIIVITDPVEAIQESFSLEQFMNRADVRGSYFALFRNSLAFPFPQTPIRVFPKFLTWYTVLLLTALLQGILFWLARL